MIKWIAAGAGALVLTVLAAVFGTGSLPGLLFGAAHRLDIKGAAPVVAPAAAGETRGWDAYGGDKGGARWSSLDEITTENVRQLKEAWSVRTGHADVVEHAFRRSAFEATPILFDDKLTLCTPFNVVLALDPGTGAEIWRFDPQIDLDQKPANKFICRGVAAWTDAGASAGGLCAKTVFMGTNDARLIALDAPTGQRCLGFGMDGEVRINPGMDLVWPGEFQITSAPAIAGDVVIVGSAISDNVRVAAPRGTVRAYDARTGALLWTFDPVPREASLAAAQGWPEGVAPVEGHANVWSTMSVDEARGLVFLPTSSPSPDFFGGLRVGDNDYANAVVALEAASGAVVWSFQTIRHDVWDYDVAVQPGLYTVTTDEGARDVVAVATKHGFVFVLDRETGEPVLPIKEIETPPTDIRGEVLAKTQPIPAITPAIVPAGVDPNEAFGLTGFDRGECKAKLKALRDDGLFTPPSLEGTALTPFTGGGANWGSHAYDPTRNLLIVPMSNLTHEITLLPSDEFEEAEITRESADVARMSGAPYSILREVVLSSLGLPCTPPPWGVLAAVDLDTGKLVWRRKVGTTEDLADGLALPIGMPLTGGPAATAGGLIFMGAAYDDYLRAFSTETGEELWKGRLPAGPQATPMVYEWKGRQYVVIAAGGHGDAGTTMGDHVVAFALPERG